MYGVASFANGHTAKHDLIIGADGIGSAVRKIIGLNQRNDLPRQAVYIPMSIPKMPLNTVCSTTRWIVLWNIGAVRKTNGIRSCFRPVMAESSCLTIPSSLGRQVIMPIKHGAAKIALSKNSLPHTLSSTRK